MAVSSSDATAGPSGCGGNAAPEGASSVSAVLLEFDVQLVTPTDSTTATERISNDDTTCFLVTLLAFSPSEGHDDRSLSRPLASVRQRS